MGELTKQERGCWAVWAYAPEGTSMRQANDAVNAYVADEARGLVLFHDHFSDRPGGVAIFDVETSDQRDAVQDPGPLAGWEFRAHPLLFAGSALGFLFQCDYTMLGYRAGRRMTTLFDEYRASDLCKRNDER